MRMAMQVFVFHVLKVGMGQPMVPNLIKPVRETVRSNPVALEVVSFPMPFLPRTETLQDMEKRKQNNRTDYWGSSIILTYGSTVAIGTLILKVGVETRKKCLRDVDLQSSYAQIKEVGGSEQHTALIEEHKAEKMHFRRLQLQTMSVLVPYGVVVTFTVLWSALHDRLDKRNGVDWELYYAFTAAGCVWMLIQSVLVVSCKTVSSTRYALGTFASASIAAVTPLGDPFDTLKDSTLSAFCFQSKSMILKILGCFNIIYLWVIHADMLQDREMLPELVNGYWGVYHAPLAFNGEAEGNRLLYKLLATLYKQTTPAKLRVIVEEELVQTSVASIYGWIEGLGPFITVLNIVLPATKMLFAILAHHPLRRKLTPWFLAQFIQSVIDDNRLLIEKNWTLLRESGHAADALDMLRKHLPQERRDLHLTLGAGQRRSCNVCSVVAGCLMQVQGIIGRRSQEDNTQVARSACELAGQWVQEDCHRLSIREKSWKLEAWSRQHCKHLYLSFNGCQNLSDAFSATMPQDFKQLHLDFTKSPNLEDEAAETISETMPRDLQQLHLQFSLCENLTDEAPKVISDAMPENLRQLHLEFSGCERLTDEALKSISEALRKNLQQLHLDFSRCPILTDEAAKAISEKLPTNLRQLHLQFSCCENLTDEAPRAISKYMPKQLEQLHLNFAGSKNLTGSALKAISKTMPTDLQQLHLNFAECDALTDEGPMAISEKMPKDLQQLHLDFSKCPDLTDEAPRSISKKMPKDLQQLHLHFAGCKQLTEEAPKAISTTMPQTLQWLLLDFSECENLTDESTSISETIPKNLQQLHLNLAGCTTLTDEALMAISANLPNDLQQLHLNLRGCENLTDEALRAISENMPKDLQQLHLDFSECDLMDEGLQAISKTMPRKLQQLHLDFSRCINLTDKAVKAISKTLPRNLQHLHLDFSLCELLTDEAPRAISENMPTDLLQLTLNFFLCLNLSVLAKMFYEMQKDFPRRVMTFGYGDEQHLSTEFTEDV